MRSRPSPASRARARVLARVRARTVGAGPVLAGTVLAVVVLAGCSSVGRLDFPVPAAGSSAPSTTVAGPLYGSATADEGTVAGATTTTTVALRPGTSGLAGTVSGPAATVGGATIEIDRLVGDQMASTEVTSRPDGAWSISGLLGGRYRVRAWRPPALAMTSPQILFLAAGRTQHLTLTMTRFGGLTAMASYDPYPAVEGRPTALSIEVSRPSVSPSGVVGYVPQPAVPVTLLAGGWRPVGSGAATTAADGIAALVATCTGVGRVPIRVVLGGATAASLPAPTCVAPPAPTTTTSTTSFPPSTSRAGRGSGSGSSTTTTAPTTTTTSPATPPVPST